MNNAERYKKMADELNTAAADLRGLAREEELNALDLEFASFFSHFTWSLGPFAQPGGSWVLMAEPEDEQGVALIDHLRSHRSEYSIGHTLREMLACPSLDIRRDGKALRLYASCDDMVGLIRDAEIELADNPHKKIKQKKRWLQDNSESFAKHLDAVTRLESIIAGNDGSKSSVKLSYDPSHPQHKVLWNALAEHYWITVEGHVPAHLKAPVARFASGVIEQGCHRIAQWALPKERYEQFKVDLQKALEKKRHKS